MNVKKLNYKHTTYACYIGYVTQAIVNNLAPLFFIIFQSNFHLSYEELGRLVFLNFGVQLITDIVATKYADKVGYRILVVAAHVLGTVGLVLLGILPKFLNNSYMGIFIAVIIYAIGGGLIEVLISPIVEALPGERKASSMSLLHSFYCWGQMAVVLFTTILLSVFGTNMWYFLPVMWAIVPFCNIFLFAKVPIVPLVADGRKSMSLKELLSNRHFKIALVLMACAGAAELTMSQWASLFAQQGLKVNKVMGDLLGPCLFAVFMGTVRMLYGLKGDRINIKKVLTASSVLCIICYSIAVFSRNPLFSLLGCALTGVSVALMWPGTFSLTSSHIPFGGTMLFGVLAVMGDLGAASGPWIAGFVSDRIHSVSKPLAFIFGADATLEQIGLKMGILVAIVFPVTMLVSLIFFEKEKSKKIKEI